MMDNAKSGGFLCHLLRRGIMRIHERGGCGGGSLLLQHSYDVVTSALLREGSQSVAWTFKGKAKSA